MSQRETPDFYVGGYYLIRGAKGPSELLPDPFWTPSDCICDVLPGVVGIPWVRSSEDEKVKLRRLLDLEPQAFEEMQTWIGELFERDYGWTDVFLNVASARTFHARYARRVPNVRLLEISLPETCLDEFLKENQPLEQQGESGVVTKLSQRVTRSEAGIVRGFDILGDELSCGSFHCFACNGLEKDYVNQLGIRLNEFGLVPDYDAAVKAAEYTNLDSTGAEPVFWQPWLVTELPLEVTRNGLAKPLYRLILGETHVPTGKTRHLRGAEVLPKPHELRIVEFDGEAGTYLIHFDTDGNELTDTFHSTVADAMEQAKWEFGIKESDWS